MASIERNFRERERERVSAEMVRMGSRVVFPIPSGNW